MSIKPVATPALAETPAPRPFAPAGAPAPARAPRAASGAAPTGPGRDERFAQALAQANRLIGETVPNLRFRADPSAPGRRVDVVDAESGHTLRSMSTEELLAIGKALDRMPGLMLKLKA